VGLELRGDRLLQLVGRHARGRHVADQREGQNAVAVERVLAGERGLAEHGNAQAVVRAKLVVGIMRRGGALALCAVGGFVSDRSRIDITGGQSKYRSQKTATMKQGDWLLR